MNLPERVDVEYSWFEEGRRNGYYPRCTVHGPMRHRERFRVWVCGGFDGEGCPARLTDEQMAAWLQQ